MVQEWAMVRDGQIVNIVTTGRKLSALKLGPPGVAFVPLSQVSQQMLRRIAIGMNVPDAV
jgi:hypothetical protein